MKLLESCKLILLRACLLYVFFISTNDFSNFQLDSIVKPTVLLKRYTETLIGGCNKSRYMGFGIQELVYIEG